MAKRRMLCSTSKWIRGPCTSCILMEILGGGGVVPTKIGPLGIKQKNQGEGKVMTLYLFKIQRRLRFEEGWSREVEPRQTAPNTPQQPKKGFNYSRALRSSILLIQPHLSTLSLPSHTKPFPFLPPSKISPMAPSWWELISRTASKVEVLHCLGSLIPVLGLCIWAENQHKPPSTFQFNGPKAASPITTRGSLKQTHPFIQSS